MQFTGRSLQMVRDGIDLAIDELQNEIATCPDVFAYSRELDALEAEQEQFRKLLARIDRAIEKEQSR